MKYIVVVWNKDRAVVEETTFEVSLKRGEYKPIETFMKAATAAWKARERADFLAADVVLDYNGTFYAKAGTDNTCIVFTVTQRTEADEPATDGVGHGGWLHFADGGNTEFEIAC